MDPDQEIESSNPLALTVLISHSHIDLHRTCFAVFNAQNLSRLVNQRLLFLGGKCDTQPHLGGALSPLAQTTFLDHSHAVSGFRLHCSRGLFTPPRIVEKVPFRVPLFISKALLTLVRRRGVPATTQESRITVPALLSSLLALTKNIGGQWEFQFSRGSDISLPIALSTSSPFPRSVRSVR